MTTTAAPRLPRSLSPQEHAERHARFVSLVWRLPTWRALCRFETVAPYTVYVDVLGTEKTLPPEWQAIKGRLDALHAEAFEHLRRQVKEEGC
jgi:hypothetical protein